jgi:glucose/arabinose dehydrogenase
LQLLVCKETQGPKKEVSLEIKPMFLTGFIDDSEKNRVHGRPVGVTVITDGSLLVTDDASNVTWQVSP